MKKELAILVTLVNLLGSVPQATTGVCPVLACSSQLSSTTCIQPVSPPSIYTFFNCASGGYSCGVITSSDGDYFLDVPSGTQAITERDCALSSQDGSPCTSNIDCGTLNCQNNVCVSGIKTENQYCGNSSQCAGDGLNCLGSVLNSPVQICIPLLQEGLGPCSSTASCVSGLWCDTSSTNYCLQKRAYSKTCTLDQQCQLGYCDRKACRPDLTLMGVGGPCTSSANCKSGLVCLDLKKNNNSEFGQDGSPDTCGNKLADAGVGCLQDSDCVGVSSICVDLLEVNTGAADTPDGVYPDTCQGTLIPYKGKGCLTDNHCDNPSSSSASYCNKAVSPFVCNYKQVTGTACSADYYCLSNICVNSVCVSYICNEHTDCPADLNGLAQYCDLASSYMCNPKIAAAVMGTDPAVFDGIECSVSYQCEDNHYCDTVITAETAHPMCKPADAATGAACLDDNQCSTAGDICLASTCQASKCRSNADCTGQYCDLNDNTCKAFIAQGAACTNDLHCNTATHFCNLGNAPENTNTCIQQLSVLSTCDRDAQCSGDKICLNTQCEEFKCQSDNDCAADEFCNTSKNLCLKDYTKNVGDVCETDKYCQSPNQCLEVTLQNGSKQFQCRSESCSQDSHCLADSSAQYCDLTNNYCKFRTDRNDPCTTDNECSSTDVTDICFWNNCVAIPTCNAGYFYNSDLQACIAQKADGGACDRNSGCTSGLCVSSTCTTQKSDGEECPLMHNDQCQNVCVYQVATSLHKCAPQISASSTTYQCNEDADCVGYETQQSKCIILTGNTLGFCKPYPQPGDNCSADQECPGEHTCIGTNICQQYTEQRCTQDLDCQSGELCIDYDYDITIEEGGDKCILPPQNQFSHCLKQEHCPTQTLYCDLADSTTFTYRQCFTKKVDSASCLANYECASSYCISSVCAATASADGAACDEDTDCSSSSWCFSLVCKAKVQSGTSCTVGSDKCVETSEQCLAIDNSGSNFLCSALHGTNQYCGSNSDCQSTLYCNSNSQCEARRTDYATCSNTELCDQNNYKCESLNQVSKCSPPLTSGSCSEDVTCATGYFCSSTNQCTAYITTDGQSCAGTDERCWTTHFCSTSNTCLQKYTKEIGEVADNDLQCKSGKSIFSRCIRVKVVSQRITLQYPYPCTVGYTCQYISDDAAQFDLDVKDCVCSGAGSTTGFCPIGVGTVEYKQYTAAYHSGTQLLASSDAAKELNRIVYEQGRHSLLQNCEVKQCLQTVDPNWPTTLTSVTELSTVCTISSEDSGTTLSLSLLSLVLVGILLLLEA